MAFKGWMASAVLAAAMVGSASAQVEVGGIGDVDPFGAGYLDEGETALPTDMWAASRMSELLPLMEKVRTSPLTPAERSLLRQVVLSPAKRPAGDEASQVLAERARIMYEIGEASAAADLLSRLEDNPTGLDAEALSVDLQLALGNHATACRQDEGRALDGPFWAKLRTVCSVLREDTAGAELAAEIAGAQGVDDEWFFSAVFASLSEEEDGPEARYDTGLNLTLSEAANLDPGETLVATSRADLAAAIARRESLPIGLRVQAGGIASEANLIEASLLRALYAELLSRDTYQATRPLEIALAPGQGTASLIRQDEATETSDGDGAPETPVEPPADTAQTDIDPAVHADHLAAALAASTGDAARFAAVSRLLMPDIEALPRRPSTSTHALVFARAAIAAGNAPLAGSWFRLTKMDGAAENDLFEQVWTEGLILLARGGVPRSTSLPVAEKIAGAADTSGKQRAAAQLFASWTAKGIATSPAARAMIAELDTPPREINEWQLLSINAAAETDAAGEVVLSVIGITGGDPAQLAPLDLVILIDALEAIGAREAAHTMALEATGYWKTLR